MKNIGNSQFCSIFEVISYYHIHVKLIASYNYVEVSRNFHFMVIYIKIGNILLEIMNENTILHALNCPGNLSAFCIRKTNTSRVTT